jgi:hypothetical protein
LLASLASNTFPVGCDVVPLMQSLMSTKRLIVASLKSRT